MRRREDRYPLEVGAHCRTVQAKVDVIIHNVSCHGCRIWSSYLPLEVGQVIVVKTKGLEALSGTIKWSQDETAGVEFDHALHAAVVDHLCRNHEGAVAQVSIVSAA